jgi:hypothetical protein
LRIDFSVAVTEYSVSAATPPAESGRPLPDYAQEGFEAYRIAVGRRVGQKLFTLQTVPPQLQGLEVDPKRLCRYVSRDVTTHNEIVPGVTAGIDSISSGKDDGSRLATSNRRQWTGMTRR